MAPLAYDATGCLLPRREDAEHHTPIIECTDRCGCSTGCPNRVVSRGLRVALTIFSTRDGRGWGLRAAETLRRGQFVCEYAGELLSSAEAEERRRAYARVRRPNYYLMSVIEHVGTPRRALTTTIDPSMKGNVGRFLNHSCAPNLEVQLVRCGSIVPRVAFFCVRDISVGDELTFDYGSTHQPPAPPAPPTTDVKGGVDGKSRAQPPEAATVRRACSCGAAGCMRWLPFDTTADAPSEDSSG